MGSVHDYSWVLEILVCQKYDPGSVQEMWMKTRKKSENMTPTFLANGVLQILSFFLSFFLFNPLHVLP